MLEKKLKKKTGTIIDGFGNIVKNNEENDNNKLLIKNTNINNNNNNNNNSKYKNDSDKKDINSYKPTGNLIYNNDMINALKNPFK